MMRGKKNNKGFSLVELIVVIAIMAVLVGILAPTLIKYVDKSRRSTDVKNASEYMSAIQTYASDHEEMAGKSAKITLSTAGAKIENLSASADNILLASTETILVAAEGDADTGKDGPTLVRDALVDAGLVTESDTENESMKLKSKSWGDVVINVTIGTDMQPSFTASNTPAEKDKDNADFDFAKQAGIEKAGK